MKNLHETFAFNDTLPRLTIDIDGCLANFTKSIALLHNNIVDRDDATLASLITPTRSVTDIIDQASELGITEQRPHINGETEPTTYDMACPGWFDTTAQFFWLYTLWAEAGAFDESSQHPWSIAGTQCYDFLPGLLSRISVETPDNETLIRWHGQYYRPQLLTSRSNPDAAIDALMKKRTLLWVKRNLSQFHGLDVVFANTTEEKIHLMGSVHIDDHPDLIDVVAQHNKQTTNNPVKLVMICRAYNKNAISNAEG